MRHCCSSVSFCLGFPVRFSHRCWVCFVSLRRTALFSRKHRAALSRAERSAGRVRAVCAVSRPRRSGARQEPRQEERALRIVSYEHRSDAHISSTGPSRFKARIPGRITITSGFLHSTALRGDLGRAAGPPGEAGAAEAD